MTTSTIGEGALAAALLLGALWLLYDGWAARRSFVSARVVLAGAALVLVALPAIVLVTDPSLYAGATRPSFSGGLALLAVGLFSLLAGARLGHRFGAGRRTEDRLERAAAARVWRGRGTAIALGLVVCLCVAAFLVAVGGPSRFFGNLDKSGASTAGLTYLIWGILLAKHASFAVVGERWASGRRADGRSLLLLGAGFLLLAGLGSRLLLLVGLVQLILLVACLRPLARRFRLLLAASAVIGVLVAVGLGELRRWQGVGEGTRFTSYLVETGVPALPGTYVNQYADSVRLAIMVREIVPGRADYEYGRELLRVFLQPLPRSIRPEIRQAPALRAAFTSGTLSGNALPVPVVGYIQFGVIGAALLSLLLGYVAGGIDRVLGLTRDVGILLCLVAGATGLVIILRGSLAQAFALATIDVIGFFVAHRLLFRGPEGARTPA